MKKYILKVFEKKGARRDEKKGAKKGARRDLRLLFTA